tara:strand:- start:272 stop:679 length:408 start_codon:yes stop_codon:yes gene_type:complete
MFSILIGEESFRRSCHHLLIEMRKQRDLPVTMYRILLYISRMKNSDDDSRRLVRIERATGIDRKELRIYLEKMEANELIESLDSGKKGRGGHPIICWNITESGRMWRSDLGRFIQLGQRLEFYPESFFYLPSDGF